MRNNLSQLISLNHIAENLYRPSNAYDQSRVTRLEHLYTIIEETTDDAVRRVANRIAERIRNHQNEGKQLVLSLVAGRTMRDLFAELVRQHKEEGLSFSNVVIVNSYEYFPLPDNTVGSMAQIRKELLDHVDIPAKNILTIPVELNKDELIDFCSAYEERINQLGGIDLQITGIGRSGNIAMNEPGTQINSNTRLVILENNSREDAKINFGSVDLVPNSAITLGFDTIMQSKEIILLVLGEHKSSIIRN
jgi:glucosamine-6-phosphate deaminase